ncbi:MAG TPA: hypothetical protein VK071_05760 [Tissierellales bacterium]|nr:hypothetical protein [Tissierellales bacterium]
MNWLKRFMAGRYGLDQLSVVLIIVNFLISILLMFFNSRILNILSMILLIIVFYRVLSKDIAKRYQENMKFLSIWNPMKNKVVNKVKQIKNLKNYKYYKCPSCKQKIRVPRGKGKISITCPKCRTVIIKNT